MKANKCMDSTEIKSYGLNSEGGEITFQGWNIKNPEKLILQELEEYFEDNHILDFKIISKLEQAFSCSKYADGVDASDEGYSYFLNHYDEWKRGYGKCTTFTISYKLKEKREYPQ